MGKHGFNILCATAAVAVLLAIVAALDQPRIQPSDHIGEPLLPGLLGVTDRLKSVVIRNALDTISLDWDGRIWRYRERDNYPTNSAKVSAIIVQLARMVKMEPKTRLADRYARLDLEDPELPNSKSRRLTLIDSAGKEVANLVVGRRKCDLSDTECGTYVRVPDDPQTWLARGDLSVGDTAEDWLDAEVANIKENDIKRVSVTHPNGDQIILSRSDPRDNIFRVENLPRGERQPDAFVTAEYGHVLSKFQPEDVAKISDKIFPKDKTISATVEGFAGFTVVMEVLPEGDKSWVRLKAEYLGSDKEWAKFVADINVKAEGWAFLVAAYQVGPLTRRMEELLKKHGPTFTSVN